MSRKELVTLNRTLAIKVGPDIEKVSSFTGIGEATWNRNDEITYQIHEIHFPTPIHILPIGPFLNTYPKLSFKKTAIVSTQDV
jgi:hypothetical protein